ncbi:hypothetical protein IGI04_034588 [Brassica rapa subsp. trilocularis]|uniref:Squalene monooxygenase n=1 Tax=Brassica rapa subsp. trilocularis TaxID=1813537 RepID=A0ABQ7L972_BRACM|nr:hypothetical protein IGI04_034588 [Brassica rapa subsp. trilocularis]
MVTTMMEPQLLGWLSPLVISVVLVTSVFAFYALFVKPRRNSNKLDSTTSKIHHDRTVTSTVGSLNVSVGDTVSDVIVVGAGVAGSALAYTLGKDNRRVHVIERDLSEPDRIVGELLQPGGYLKLLELGIEDCVEEIDAQRVYGYALFKNGKRIRLAYPLEKFHTDVSGRSFHNGRFIQRMREKAASLPNVQLEQGTVVSLLEENGTIKGVRYKNKAGEESTAFAALTIVCDGCFSNLRRSLCNPQPVASTINTLANALYKVFCSSKDEARNEMREACFDYLSLGGMCTSGPVSLLSGLNPRPLTLVCHFFAVAVYGVIRLLIPFPSPKRMWLGAKLISGASGIIFPIIKAEGVRQMFFPATVPAYYRAPPVKGETKCS